MTFYILISLLIVEILAILFTYSFFRLYHATSSQNIIKGESISYEITISNTTPIVFCQMRIFYAFGKEIELIVYPKSVEKIREKIKFNHRGKYNVGIKKIKIIGFLGLISFDYKLIEPQQVFVNPRIYTLKPLNFHNRLVGISDSIISYDNSSKSLFSDVRDYIKGDSLNKIHWKLSASKNRYITKLYDGDMNHKIKIFIDNSTIKELDHRLDIEDNLIEGGVSLCKYLLQNNSTVEIIWSQKRDIIYSGGQISDFQTFYKALSHIQFNQKDEEIEKIIDRSCQFQSEKSAIIIFSSNINFKLCQNLLNKKKEGFEVNIIIPKIVLNEAFKHYELMDLGIKIFHITFKNGNCLMELVK